MIFKRIFKKENLVAPSEYGGRRVDNICLHANYEEKMKKLERTREGICEFYTMSNRYIKSIDSMCESQNKTFRKLEDVIVDLDRENLKSEFIEYRKYLKTLYYINEGIIPEYKNYYTKEIHTALDHMKVCIDNINIQITKRNKYLVHYKKYKQKHSSSNNHLTPHEANMADSYRSGFENLNAELVERMIPGVLKYKRDLIEYIWIYYVKTGRVWFGLAHNAILENSKKSLYNNTDDVYGSFRQVTADCISNDNILSLHRDFNVCKRTSRQEELDQSINNCIQELKSLSICK